VATTSAWLRSLAADPTNGTSVVTSTASRDEPQSANGRQTAPSDHTPSDDAVARRNRDVLLILGSQRRRRRARGY
jgi:hypothetical protein